MAENDFDLSEFDSARNEQFDEDDGEWVDLNDGDVLQGELVRVVENAGKYDSRVYEIDTGLDENRLMWGNGSVDSQVDEAGIEPGDLIHIKRDGTYENKYGTHPNFEVMFKRQD